MSDRSQGRKQSITRLLLVLSVICMLLISVVPVFAEGLRELIGGDDGANLSALRRNIDDIYYRAYMKPGETLYLGSQNHDDAVNDFVVISPSGKETPLDIAASGEQQGEILSREQLKYGARQLVGTNGYYALEYEAKEEGIYFIHFPSNNKYARQYWDISVGGTDGKEKKGRVFATKLYLEERTSAIPLNMVEGTWYRYTLGVYYVLTPDGFVYKVDTGRFNPEYYTIASTNRGTINLLTNEGLPNSYRSADTTDPDQAAHTYEGRYGGVTFVTFDTNDQRGLDKTNWLFFNVPDRDAMEFLGAGTPKYPVTVTNLSFRGTADGETKEGLGGFFTFDTTVASGFELVISFNAPAFRDRIIHDNAVEGTNNVWWDGEDADGKPVTPGNYSVKVKAIGGSNHFLLEDIEALYDGVRVDMVIPQGYEKGNVVYYNVSDFTANDTFFDMGAIHANLLERNTELLIKLGSTAENVDGLETYQMNPGPAPESHDNNGYQVFYGPRDGLSGVATDGNNRVYKTTEYGEQKYLVYHDEIDSGAGLGNPPSPGTLDSYFSYPNNKNLHFWTNYQSDEIEEPFIITDDTGTGDGNAWLRGLVYWDADQSGTYLPTVDYGLEKVPVTIEGGGLSAPLIVYTDSTGYYERSLPVSNITYNITINAAYYICTTCGSANQTCSPNTAHGPLSRQSIMLDTQGLTEAEGVG